MQQIKTSNKFCFQIRYNNSIELIETEFINKNMKKTFNVKDDIEMKKFL